MSNNEPLWKMMLLAATTAVREKTNAADTRLVADANGLQPTS